MLLRTMTGSENWRDHAAKVHVFYSPTAADEREVHIGVASREPGTAISSISKTSASARLGFTDPGGMWTDATYDVPEGVVLKIFANRVGGFGTANLSANQFIRMREEAALTRVTVPLSPNPAARYASVFVQGRFDLLTYGEAQTLGAKVLPQFKRHSEPVMLRRVFQIATIEPQIRPRAVVETREVRVGEAVVPVMIRRRSRTMLI